MKIKTITKNCPLRIKLKVTLMLNLLTNLMSILEFMLICFIVQYNKNTLHFHKPLLICDT